MKNSLLKHIISWIVFLMLCVAPMITSLAPPLREEYKEERLERMQYVLRDNSYNDSLDIYIKDVQENFVYSSRDSAFLTKDYINLVVNNCTSYPSVVLAMSILESGWGLNAIGNNYFGVKGKGHIKTTKEWNGKRFITMKQSFKKYNSLAEGIQDHSRLLHTSRYDIGTATTYYEAIEMIAKGGYATDPYYVGKVNFIIKKYELYRIDDMKAGYDTFFVN